MPRRSPLLVLFLVIMLIVLVTQADRISSTESPEQSERSPALVLSQLPPSSNGDSVQYYHKLSQEVNGTLSTLESIVSLCVVETNAESYEVAFGIEVRNASGVFEGISPSLSDTVVVDSALHTLVADCLASYSLAVFFPASLAFGGTPLFSNGPEIHPGDTWAKDGVTFRAMTVSYNGTSAIAVSARSIISNGTLILSQSEWPYVEKMSITTEEQFQPFTHSHIPQGPATGILPPPSEIVFPELVIIRIVEAERLD